MRLAQTQVCPALRYLDAIAPLTATSMSASSTAMNGALPPNSIEVFLTVAAHCCISKFADLRRAGESQFADGRVRAQLAAGLFIGWSAHRRPIRPAEESGGPF